MASAITTTRAMDTLPKLLKHHAEVRPNHPAMREKDFGIWQTWSWKQVHDEIMALAAGFSALGVSRGATIALVGDNRPQLYWSMVAVQVLGGVPVPVYQDSVAREMQFVLEHAEAVLAVVEDQEQVDKLLEIKDQCPKLQTILFEDDRGMRDYHQPFIHSLASVQEKGRALMAANPGFLDGEIAKGKGSDIGVMLYTSGTTGQPKGVMLTFDNVLITARNNVEMEGLTPDEDVLAYLPMAWVGDHLFSMAQAYVCGFTVNCPENGETLLIDLRELGPTYFFSPPRIYENILTTVMIRMEDASPLKRKMFGYFMDVARRVGVDILDGKPVSFGDRLLYGMGNALVYGPLKNVLGFSRIKLAYTAGEAIGPEIFSFYRSLGINIKQIYGSTEASVFICVQPNGEVYADTVGKPAPGVELKIAENGEVLFRSPGVFQAYFKKPDKTAEDKTADGWVHTGDAGIFNEQGHLKIIDRAKDVGRMLSGQMFPPKYLENKLKFFPFIKEAVAFGDKRDSVGCFINIDLEAVGNWAERRGLAYSGFQDLAAQTVVYDLIQECVEKVNADLAADPMLSGCQIGRFLLLHKELDADDGELTRTRKVRRKFINERYADQIEALFDGRTSVRVETEVTFEDGRKGVVRADLAIRAAAVKPAPATPLRKAG
ncbi:AMP-binding protein [Novispirillum itersonii]|uniref:Long-chain acyl-CoA synthetase n=1 Tax=Novispirillum itersonii TaxID=189 RepID=A0A7W9ZGE8_NOVIT|nr:AMP-binding protein [Novispirillum itersonii]MBB6209819.1 long-chain acyl-CoA synthetase [Novispirillum itersonii]